jgi:hypothetical protein
VQIRLDSFHALPSSFRGRARSQAAAHEKEGERGKVVVFRLDNFGKEARNIVLLVQERGNERRVILNIQR